MRKIIWSSLAISDLRRIDNWLTAELSPQVADDYLSAIRQRCEVLQDFPQRGARVDDEARKLLVPTTPYIMLYDVTDFQIEVLRVFHNRENWRDNS